MLNIVKLARQMKNSLNKKKWFLVQNKPNHHFVAKENLVNQGFNVFLPLIEITRRKSLKFVNETSPLFPGYMFIEFDEINSNWSKINNTKGVNRLVCFSHKPKSVPSELINAIRLRCSSSNIFRQRKELKKGDIVEFFKGPFTNFLAKVEKCDSIERVWVLIEIMGQTSLSKVNVDHLQLIKKSNINKIKN